MFFCFCWLCEVSIDGDRRGYKKRESYEHSAYEHTPAQTLFRTEKIQHCPWLVTIHCMMLAL